jgi:GAF domain-containing protein
VTAEFVREIDTLQYEVHNEGPCISAMRTRQPCISGSIGEDIRWPRFGPPVARLGVKSALSVPLMLGERMVGAINAYAYGLDTFAQHAMAMGTKFAGPAAVSVYNAWSLMEARHRAEQLQRALGSRSVIHQAIGIVRGRSGASAEEAFGWLVKVSQSENVRLHVTAERLVEESVRGARARHDRS